MIPQSTRRLIEETDYALLASASAGGEPHLAAGYGLRVVGDNRVIFDAWFCHRTLENIAENPNVAVMVLDRSGRKGYQLTGQVEKTEEVAILDGFVPTAEKPGTPQVEETLLVRVDAVTRFSGGVHTDHPL
ncbi:MAG: pyridoxamine 5'-phosphate oxidase family protein [Desulfuromonadales bacterium]